MHERHHGRDDAHCDRRRTRHVSDDYEDDIDPRHADDLAHDHDDDLDHDHEHEGDGHHRSWADKAADEVKSWFGNDRAEHRRDHDEAHEERHEAHEAHEEREADEERHEAHNREARREARARDVRREERRDFRGVGPIIRHDEDEELRDMVCQRLAEDPDLDASGILVRVIDNEVILDGAVDGRHNADRAAEMALDVPGIIHVRDRLDTDRRAPDTDLRSDRVRRATIGMGYDDKPPRRRRRRRNI